MPMNLLHMKYAVEIARTNSINKAAETLYVGQSALSRAVKELEASLGVAIFERSAKGMTLTADGEVFVHYAEMVLKQVEALETMFGEGGVRKKRFSASVPRASYIAEAFARFSRSLQAEDEVEVYYKETNSMRTVRNLLQEDYKLGIIRYAENYDKYYKAMMDEKGLAYELVAEFGYCLTVSVDSPLAARDTVSGEELHRYTEITHADPYVPSLPFEEVKKEEIQSNSLRQIFVFERASQFGLLSQNPDTFLWGAPIPQSLLDRYGLVQKPLGEQRRMYRDVLIHRKEYTLSELDHRFIEEIVRAKRELLG